MHCPCYTLKMYTPCCFHQWGQGWQWWWACAARALPYTVYAPCCFHHWGFRVGNGGWGCTASLSPPHSLPGPSHSLPSDCCDPHFAPPPLRQVRWQVQRLVGATEIAFGPSEHPRHRLATAHTHTHDTHTCAHTHTQTHTRTHMHTHAQLHTHAHAREHPHDTHKSHASYLTHPQPASVLPSGGHQLVGPGM